MAIDVTKKLTDLELYGTTDVPVIPPCILHERIRILDNHLGVYVHMKDTAENYEVRNHMINKILAAKDFWRRFLNDEGEV